MTSYSLGVGILERVQKEIREFLLSNVLQASGRSNSKDSFQANYDTIYVWQ